MSGSTRIGQVLLLLATASCGDDPVGTGEFEVDRVMVEGQLVALGEPVDRANIRIRVLPLGCEGESLTTILDVHPDSEGRFRREVTILASTPTGFLGCIEVQAVPLGGGGLITTTALRDEQLFVRVPGNPPTVEFVIEIDID